MVSAVGSGAMFVALPYYTYVTTGSVVATALVTLAEYAPTVGIAQLAGLMVDRWDPRRVTIVANLALAACTLAYLVHEAWWWLAVVAFARSCAAQFVLPAGHTLVPAVAPPGRLAEVNGLNAIGGHIARLTGPAVGGALLGVSGLHTVVIVDAATFVTAAILVAAVRLPDLTRQPPTGGLVQLWRAGWSTVRDHPVLRPLVAVMALVGFGEGFVSALLAPWMINIVGGGSAELGLMLSLQALGGILGGLLVLRWAHRWHSLSLLCVGAIVSGVLLVVIINYPLVAPVGPWPAILLTALAGLPFALYGTAQVIAVQAHSTDGLRGRVVSSPSALKESPNSSALALPARRLATRSAGYQRRRTGLPRRRRTRPQDHPPTQTPRQPRQGIRRFKPIRRPPNLPWRPLPVSLNLRRVLLHPRGRGCPRKGRGGG